MDIETLRKRILAGEPVKDEEIAQGIQWLRDQRGEALTARKQSRASKGVVSEKEMDDIFEKAFGHLEPVSEGNEAPEGNGNLEE